MIGAGSFMWRLRFEARGAPSGDDMGSPEGGPWVEQFTVSAQVKPLKGSETVQAARLTGVQMVIITVRQTVDTLRIASTWRAVDVRTGAEYAVIAPPSDPEMKRRHLDIPAAIGRAA